MMEIRTCQAYYLKLSRQKTQIEDIHVTLDEKAQIPVIMSQNEKGKLQEYMRGYQNIKNYLKCGYNRIIRKCPLRHRKCIGENCAWYFVDNNTGDCAMIWQLFRGKLNDTP